MGPLGGRAPGHDEVLTAVLRAWFDELEAARAAVDDLVARGVPRDAVTLLDERLSASGYVRPWEDAGLSPRRMAENALTSVLAGAVLGVPLGLAIGWMAFGPRNPTTWVLAFALGAVLAVVGPLQGAFERRRQARVARQRGPQTLVEVAAGDERVLATAGVVLRPRAARVQRSEGSPGGSARA